MDDYGIPSTAEIIDQLDDLYYDYVDSWFNYEDNGG